MPTSLPNGFSNSILICVDCGEEFVFTASAQEYFAERGFTDPPKRCKSCYNEYRVRGGPHAEVETPSGNGDRPAAPSEDRQHPAAGDRPA